MVTYGPKKEFGCGVRPVPPIVYWKAPSATEQEAKERRIEDMYRENGLDVEKLPHMLCGNMSSFPPGYWLCNSCSKRIGLRW